MPDLSPYDTIYTPIDIALPDDELSVGDTETFSIPINAVAIPDGTGSSEKRTIRVEIRIQGTTDEAKDQFDPSSWEHTFPEVVVRNSRGKIVWRSLSFDVLEDSEGCYDIVAFNKDAGYHPGTDPSDAFCVS